MLSIQSLLYPSANYSLLYCKAIVHSSAILTAGFLTMRLCVSLLYIVSKVTLPPPEAKSEIYLLCGNKMPTRCNRGFYCRSYCLLNMFRASPCPSSGAQEYYTVDAACGILCCGFSSSWSGVELRVMRPVCRMLVCQ